MAAKLQIDMDINESGVAEGLERINGAVSRFVSGVAGKIGRLDAQQRARVERMNATYNKQLIQIQRVENQISQLQTKLSDMSQAENAPRSILLMEKEVTNLDKQLAQLNIKFEKLSMAQEMNISAKVDMSRILEADRQLEELGAEIRRTEERAVALKAKLAALRTNPQASAEGRKLAADLALAQQRLEELTRRAQETGAAITVALENKASRAANKAAGSIDRVSRATRKAGSNANGILGSVSKSFEKFGNRLRSTILTGLLFYHIRRAMIALGRQMWSLLKTNATFSKSLSQIKGNLATAFMPIYNAILPAINILMKALVTLTSLMANLFSWLFGVSTAASAASASVSGVGGSLDSAGSSAKKAKKELASFDQIEVLSKEDESESGGGGGAGGGVAPDYAAWQMSPELESGLERFKQWLLNIWEAALPTRKALERLWKQIKIFGTFVGAALIDFYKEFLSPLAHWTLGEGLPRLIDGLTLLMSSINYDLILSKLQGVWQALLPFAINVGEGLLWFYENVLIPIGTWAINDALPVFLDLVAAGLNLLNTVMEAAGPVIQEVYNNVLVPLGEWAGGAIVDILNWLVEAFNNISIWITENQELFEWLVKILISMAAAWLLVHTYLTIVNTATSIFNAAMFLLTNPIGQVILIIGLLIAAVWWLVENWELVEATAVACWEWIKTAWNDAGKWIHENVTQPIADWFSTLWTNISTWCSEAWQWVVDTWVAVSEWFDTNVVTPVAEFFTTLWTNISTWASTAWTDIVNTWTGVKKWFQDNIIDPISTAFSTAWESISGFFSSAWESIKTVWLLASDWFQTNVITPVQSAFNTLSSAITGVINGILGFINGMIDGMQSGINGIVRAINSIGFDVGPIYAFGAEVLPHISVRPNVASVDLSSWKIPLLAQGAVIPPNNEFMAILGDQKRGTNIEAPADLIRQIIREELSSLGSMQPKVQIEFIGELAALGRLLKPVLKNEEQRIGTPILSGGDY